VRSTRRDFIAGAAALVTAAGCGLHGQSDQVETFGPGLVSGPSALDSTLTLGMPADGAARITIESFKRRTGVDVTVETFGTDDDLLLSLAAGAQGRLDAILVGADTLGYLVSESKVEPVDGALVADRSTLEAPFSDPPADPNLEHSVPLDFVYPGVAIRRSLSLSDLSWAAFFALPKTYPLQVTIPDEPDIVIGAALLATGHDWNSDDDGDLQDVADLLAPLRGVIRVSRRPPAIGPGAAVAAMVRSLEAVQTGRRSRFYLPTEGSAVLVRSWTIPIYAPHPVSANAWLANALNPAVAAGQSEATRRPTPVAAARPLVEPSLLRDPRVYPPPGSSEVLVAPDVSVAVAGKRRAIWQDLAL
jgi:spermidine/putrescine transport system substrate-binding protein